MAVYGSLRSGAHNHHVLQGALHGLQPSCSAVLLGVGVLGGVVLYDTGHGYPMAVLGADPKIAGVACEVYAVPPAVLERVRRLEAGYQERRMRLQDGTYALAYVQTQVRRGLRLVSKPEGAAVQDWFEYLVASGQGYLLERGGAL